MAPTAAVDAYVAKAPAERRAALAAVRALVNERLPAGYEEGLSGTLITWSIPLSVKPDTYNKQPLMVAALGAGTSVSSLHLMGCYLLPAVRDALVAGFARAGKKLDMGKACVRFKKLDDLVLPALGKALASVPPKKLVALHDASHPPKAKTKAKTKPVTKAKAKARAKPATKAKPATARATSKR